MLREFTVLANTVAILSMYGSTVCTMHQVFLLWVNNSELLGFW